MTNSSVSISSVFIPTSFPFPERTTADYEDETDYDSYGDDTDDTGDGAGDTETDYGDDTEDTGLSDDTEGGL